MNTQTRIPGTWETREHTYKRRLFIVLRENIDLAFQGEEFAPSDHLLDLIWMEEAKNRSFGWVESEAVNGDEETYKLQAQYLLSRDMDDATVWHRRVLKQYRDYARALVDEFEAELRGYK